MGSFMLVGGLKLTLSLDAEAGDRRGMQHAKRMLANFFIEPLQQVVHHLSNDLVYLQWLDCHDLRECRDH